MFVFDGGVVEGEEVVGCKTKVYDRSKIRRVIEVGERVVREIVRCQEDGRSGGRDKLI